MKCSICNKELKRISNTHLKQHDMTMKQYAELYPNEKMEEDSVMWARAKYSSGKTYEELYGHEKAKQLRLIRKKGAEKQFMDLKQRLLRSSVLTGRILSDETKKKLSNSKLSKYNKAWLDLREKLLIRSGGKCENCGITENNIQKGLCKHFIIHHKNYNKYLADLDDVLLLCPTCHAKCHWGKNSAKGRQKIYSQLQQAIIKILQALQIPVEDENFIETPRRVASWLLEFTGNNIDLEKELEEIASSIFSTESDNCVSFKNIKVFSVCPHHFLPVIYNVSFAYIPNIFCIGASKVPRIIKLLAKIPMLQETFTYKLVEEFEKLLKTENIMVVVEGEHMCLKMRGVEQLDTILKTSAVKGIFKESEAARNEFFSLLNQK